MCIWGFGRVALKLWRLWVWLPLWAACASTVWAVGLQVSPVSLTLSGQQNAQALWLQNTGKTQLQAQVRVFHWTQINGHSVLKPATELVASPPMVAIPPGQRQIIRIVRAGGAAPAVATEQAFRLLVDEIPTLDKPGVQFVLRYSVPVFVTANASAMSPALNWSVQRRGNTVSLQVTNTGSGHAKISNVAFTAASGKKIVLSKGLYGYVLANNSRNWQLEHYGQTFLGGGELTALVNTQKVTVHLSSTPTGK